MGKFGINMPSQPIYWTEMAAGDNPNSNYKPVGATLGAPTEYNRGSQKYNTSGLMYPSDLMSAGDNQYGNNYVIFYINVHEDSFLAKDGGTTSFIDGTQVPARQRGPSADLSSGSIVAASMTAGAVAANKADISQRVVGAGGGKLKDSAATVVDTITGAIGAGAVIAAVGGPKNELKRQRKAIALHVPTDLSVRYTASWDAESLAGSIALATASGPALAGALGGGLLGGLFKGKKGALIGAGLGAGAGTLASGAGNYAAGLAIQAPGGQLLGKTSGTAANPKKEQLFKEVDYRTFTFSYQFFPRNATEAANVRSIIKEFKLHMHPEFRDASQFLYIYPSEFDIFYYQNGKENLNLHRHTSCVLTDLSVSYAPQGTFSTFADGMPTQINVQMTFKELALLTKQNIVDGF